METTQFLKRKLEAQDREIAVASERLQQAQNRRMYLEELLVEAQNAMYFEQKAMGEADDDVVTIEGCGGESQEVGAAKKMRLHPLATLILSNLPDQKGHLDEIVKEAQRMGYEINRTSLQSMLSRNRDDFYPLAAGTGQWTLAHSDAAHQDQLTNDELTSPLETSMNEIVEMENMEMDSTEKWAPARTFMLHVPND